ncbi:Putative deoxyribonuclease RhsC [Corynebacterium cystitidis DSM 20524]|nr:Putative deoxyribonuclease RhsC [Corynebacterium cystitidis DSM 20524]SNV61810.1 Uncharacterized conserved protein [Corynebacterium cystitidis]
MPRDKTRTTTPSRPPGAKNLHDNDPGHTTNPPGSTGQETVVTESYGFSPAGVLSSIATPTISTSSGAVAPAATSVAPAQTAATATADAQVDFQGTKPTRVGRTTYTYDRAGRVTYTVTKRVCKKPLVKHFYYAASGQPIGYDTSDEPGVGYRYIYDGLDRRVAKERVDTTTGRVLARMVFAHRGNQLVAQQTTLGPDRGAGFVWTHDPASGEIIGQITLTGTDTHVADTGSGNANPGDVRNWDQDRVDAEFFALVADLAGAPHEIIDPATGDVAGSSSQTLYGTRTWHGEQSSPLLFAGQYYDDESGWAYNRFRYYHPDAGIYNAQDPLGAAPRIASTQGYVNHPAHWVDVLGLMANVQDFMKSDLADMAPGLGKDLQTSVVDVITKVGDNEAAKRRTFAMAIVESPEGSKVLAASSGKHGKPLDPLFARHLPDTVAIGGQDLPVEQIASNATSSSGRAHAEESIVNFVKNDESLTMTHIAASKQVCRDTCLPAISGLPNGVEIVTRIRRS